MITATLTNPRHIAGANAAYLATIPVQPEAPAQPIPIPYANVEEYVQARLNKLGDSWADSTKVDVISVADFILRFTSAEFAAITASANPNVINILATLRARLDVRLGSPDAVNGVAYLVAIGLLTQERAALILQY